MRHLARITLSLFIILSPALCRAENDTITHEFNTLFSVPRQMSITNSNTVGTVDDGVVYTCSNSAKFWYGSSSELPLSINLPSTGSQVVTTKINNLKEINCTYYPAVTLYNIAIQLSSDGSSWSDPLTGVSCKSGLLHVAFSKGDYYVKIYNTNGSAYNVSISVVQFIREAEFCNCFIYTP